MQELIHAARRGDAAAMAALWGRVKRLGYAVANQYNKAAAANGAADGEDLIQCAALGMMEALRSYDPENGSFPAWFCLYVRKACRECLGLRGRVRREHYNTISTDTPVSYTEDLTIGDTLEDDAAVESFDAVEDRNDLEILRRDLAAALSQLPDAMRAAITRHDLEGHPLHPEEVQPRKTGLARLRRDPIVRQYAPNYHRHKGLAAFKTSWSSVVEDEVIKKLDRRQ